MLMLIYAQVKKELSIGLGFENCRALIGSEAATKSRFSVRDRVFANAGIKQRKHLV